MQEKNEREQPIDRFRQENETLLHAFAMHNIDGIALINEAGIIVEWNRVMEEITGLSAQETLDAQIWDIQSLMVSEEKRTPNAAERYRKIFQEMLRTGVIPEQIVSNVSQIHRNDGREVYAEQKLFIIKTDSANWLGAVVRDVTDRKKAQDDLLRRAEQMATIVEIGHAVSTLQDLDNVLEIIYRQIQRIVPADALFIALWDEEKNRLTFPLTYDLGVRYKQDDTSLRPGSPLDYVIQNGKPYRIHRTPQEIAELENSAGDVGDPKLRSKSLLYVPLWQANRVIGAFSIQSYAYNSYSDELVETVSAVADQVAIAIQNARLFTNVQKELAERKLAEQALRFSEEKFSKSFHTTQVLMTLEGADNVIIDVNRAFLETFGLEREAVIGKTIPDLNILYNRDDLKLLRREYQQKGALKDFEIRIRNKTGELGFVLLSSDNFYVNNAAYTLTSGLDITTRKQAETKLQNSEALYRRAINAAGAVPYYRDTRADTYTFMGEGILAITGYSASEMTPKLWEALEQEKIPRGSLAHLSYEQASWIINEDPSVLWECDYRIRTRNGQTRWVADTSVKGYNESGEEAGVIGILQDITDRKQYEQEIQQRLQELDAIHTVSKAAASALEFNPLFDLVSTELFELFDIQEIYFALHDWETNEVRFPYYRRGDQRIETDAVPFGQGLSSRVIMTREPLLINQDYERRSAELGVVRFSQPKTSLNQVSWLGVPIRAGEQVIGMICMMNLVRENAFAQTDLVLLATIAANVGIAIRNAQLYMTAQQELTERKRVEVDLRKRESILEAITFSAEQFLMQPHWRKSINEVLERLGKEFNASHAYLFERHLGENGVNLSSLRYEWAAPGQTADIDNPDYQNMEEYETEFSRYYQTLDQGEPFVGSSSAFTDEEREYFASEGIKALLEMRITVNGQQWGALGFDDLVNEREWTAMEVDVLKVAANVLGAAIKRRSDEEMLKRELEERKRAQDDLQRRAQQLATLNEINRTVSELKNLDEVLEVIYQQTQRIASADAFYIALWDEQRNEVSYPIIYDLGMRYTESSQPLRSDSWIRQVLLTGQPYRLNRTEEELKVPASRTVGNEQRKSASILVIPLRQNKKILGVLSVQSYTMNAYSDEVVDILIGIGYQAAIAIENARLFTGMQQELAERKRAESALQKTTSRLELLHNIDRALLYAQSPEQIANEALSRIRQLIPSQRVSITLFDFEKNEARVAAANFDEDYFPSGRSFVTLEEYGQYIIDELLQDKPFRVDDVLTDSRAIELDKALAQKGFRSWLYLPLFSQGRLIGALNLARTGEIPFTAEEEAIGYEVANQLAIVLQQNRLLEALQTELSERKHMQEILFEEKERAEVTLYSIGDAVITTNEQAYVTYLNPVAESLLGWNMAEAAGEPLEKIFHVIEEGSRKPIASPVERCLQEGRIVGLPQHSILISRDGMEYAIDDSAAPIRNRQGETIGAVLVFHDVTEERRLLQQIAHDAMHDSLTGLVNRREFERRLEYALTSVQEHGLSHILCYLDMDQFKIVNDTAGHAAGDELLRQVVRLLRGTFRQRDTFARLGGDEFGLLLENCQLDQALVICNEIRTKIREIIFSWEGQNFQVRVSIGVVPINVNTESVTQLLSQADIACYSAKDLGRDRIHVYEIGDIETTRRYNEILQASRLRDAITNNQFRLYCQPISRLLGEETEFKHYEVLMRMMDTEEHLVMPGAFIPPAERYGLMPAIDRWVIRATLMAMSRHATQGMQFAINLSGTSLDDETLLEYVLEQIREFSIPPEQICFEITETAAIHHLNKAQQFIQAFRGQGGKISLDDFGSGFSSFRYLKSLPVDYLKIDGSFVHDMLSNRSDQVMVEAITLIAHTLNIGVIAEHASELEIITRLREIGVEYAQGMGIGIPIPMEEVWGKDSSPEG